MFMLMAIQMDMLHQIHYPSYTITNEVIKETITGIAQTSINFSLDAQDPINGLYNHLKFNFDSSRDLKFIQGDAIVYNSIKDPNSANSDPSDVIPGSK